jgi:hypothetical protein
MIASWNKDVPWRARPAEPMRGLLIFAAAATIGGFAIGALGDLLDLDGTATTILIAVWVALLLGFGGARARDRSSASGSPAPTPGARSSERSDLDSSELAEDELEKLAGAGAPFTENEGMSSHGTTY